MEKRENYYEEHAQLTEEYLQLLINSPLQQEWHQGFIDSFFTFAISIEQKLAEIKNLKRIIDTEEKFLKKLGSLNKKQFFWFEKLYLKHYLNIDREEILLAAVKYQDLEEKIEKYNLQRHLQKKDADLLIKNLNFCSLEHLDLLENLLLNLMQKETSKTNSAKEENPKKAEAEIKVNQKRKDTEFKDKSTKQETTTKKSIIKKEKPNYLNTSKVEKVFSKFTKSSKGKALDILCFAHNTMRFHEKIRSQGETLHSKRNSSSKKSLKIHIPDFIKDEEKIKNYHLNFIQSNKQSLYSKTADIFTFQNSEKQEINEKQSKIRINNLVNKELEKLSKEQSFNQEEKDLIFIKVKTRLAISDSSVNLKKSA